MKNAKTRWMQGVALGALTVLTAAPALAQSTTIETVVVTAERRSTDIQTTPIAVTVLSGADLKARNIDVLDSLAFTTPSLTVQDSGQNVLLNIRGIGKNDGGAQDSVGVVTYRDGATTTYNGFVADEPYYDISSIQILRGPQGTFAGQNATGGAILITETDPNLDSVNGFVEGQYGNYNDVRLQGAVNIPLSDTFAVRIATDEENRDSFYTMSGPFTGNAGNLHMANLRVSALWQPDDHFKATLKLDGNYIDHGAPIGAPFSGSTKNIFHVASDAHLQGIDQQFRAVLNMEYAFDDGLTLKSISSYQYGVVKFNSDEDGTASFFANSAVDFGPAVIGSIGKAQVVSQEVNLISPDKGPFSWVVGAVYLDEQIFAPLLYTSAAPGGTLTSGLVLNAASSFAREDNWGVFGQANYKITDALKLQVGLRYSESLENSNQTENALFNGVPFPLFTPIHAVASTHDSKVTGKIDLDWTMDQNNFLYAFVATGHKAAGLNGDGTKYTGENVTDYEVGWKAKFFDGHVQTQLDGYYDNYSNFVMSLFDPLNALGAAGTEDLNVPGTTVAKGIEAQVQAAFGGLSLDFGASYEDTAIPTFFAIDARNPFAGVQNLSGRALPNAPKWTAQFGAQYVFDLGDEQTLTPRLDYGFVSGRWGSVFQISGNPLLPDDRLGAQNLLNGQLAYNFGEDWQAVLYGTNLTDLHYVSTELLGKLGFPGAPRQFGIRVTRSF
ncbi:MAG TPA: TonB-dependent receptor [Rhizomicrobium sp.]|jgi:iron complex outermembrane receptor protein|nr:TonB-dependent receptor [Rhizomicrobium sp.]